jgi:histone H3/H4
VIFSNSLIHWYLNNKRDLPWRNTHDPYNIWLSEIMLQQTRVAQGLPYYLDFISTFPTVYDLAKAPEEKVLKHWLKEIRVMQRSTEPGIPRAPFLRLSQEIMSCFNSSLSMSRDAAQALQDSAEAYLTGLFEDSNRCAVHAGRVTVQAKDMNLARVLGKHPDAREGQDFVASHHEALHQVALKLGRWAV